MSAGWPSSAAGPGSWRAIRAFGLAVRPAQVAVGTRHAVTFLRSEPGLSTAGGYDARRAVLRVSPRAFVTLSRVGKTSVFGGIPLADRQDELAGRRRHPRLGWCPPLTN